MATSDGDGVTVGAVVVGVDGAKVALALGHMSVEPIAYAQQLGQRCQRKHAPPSPEQLNKQTDRIG
jgi:hypothetical protein